MAREIDDPRKPHLWPVGQTVYLQGNAKQVRSKQSQVSAAAFSKQAIVDWLMGQHGMILGSEDIYPDGSEAPSRFAEATEQVHFESGSHGMVLSQFWIESLPTEEELQKNPELEPGYAIYCFIMVKDKMILVPHKVCTKVA